MIFVINYQIRNDLRNLSQRLLNLLRARREAIESHTDAIEETIHDSDQSEASLVPPTPQRLLAGNFAKL